jgi:hypothetical protein
MELKRVGSQPSIKGPDAWFTGTVRIDPLNPGHEGSRVSAANRRTPRHPPAIRATLRCPRYSRIMNDEI